MEYFYGITRTVKNYVVGPSIVMEPQPEMDETFAYDILRSVLKNDRSDSMLFSPVNMVKMMLFWIDAEKNPSKGTLSLKERILKQSKIPELLKMKNGLEIHSALWTSLPYSNGSDPFLSSHDVDTIDANGESLLKTLNNYISKKTRGMLKDVLKKAPESLCHLEIIYFKFSWLHAMKDAGTIRFTTSKGIEKELPSIKSTSKNIKAINRDRYFAATIPFSHKNYEITLVMPKKKSDLDTICFPNLFREIAACDGESSLEMPRIDIQKTLEEDTMASVFSDMGMNTSVNPCFLKGDDRMSLKSKQISRLVLNKEGVEFASVQVSVLECFSGPIEIDRPFLLIIHLGSIPIAFGWIDDM